jgi:hypothetical protein
MNRNRTGLFASVLSGSAVLLGCSSTPVVTYDTYNSDTVLGAKDLNSVPNTYELWTTQLEFVKDVSKPMTVSVGAAPVSSGATVFSIAGESHWYKSTDVKLATASDATLLSSVSVSTTDNRASYITTAGELVGTILTVAGVAAAPEPGTAVARNSPTCGSKAPLPSVNIAYAFDEVVNLFDALQKAEMDQKCGPSDKSVSFILGNFDDGVGDFALVTISSPPPSAVLINNVSLPVIKATAKNVFLYSACRRATVEYFGAGPITQKSVDGQAGDPKAPASQSPANSGADQSGGGRHQSGHGSVAHAPEPAATPPTPPSPAPPTPSVVHRKAQFLFADPRYVQAIQLPVKGTLTVKSECGMTAGTDSGTADSGSAVAKALADALQSATGKGSSGSGKSTGKTNAAGK